MVLLLTRVNLLRPAVAAGGGPRQLAVSGLGTRILSLCLLDSVRSSI